MIRVPTSAGILFAGPVSFPEDLDHYDLIWNLASELSSLVDKEKEHADVVLQGRISDFSIPIDVNNFISQLNMVVSCLQGGGKVFVHCRGGIGRTSMAVSLILYKLGAPTIEDALDTVWKLFGGPETRLQKHFVKYISKKF